ncbi:MAG: triose-phosphate isomerase [Candidatus Paceibacterota bacterium]
MKPLIVANWKMNPDTLAEAEQLLNSVAEGIKETKNTEVVICPPHIYFSIFNDQPLKDIKIGAQNSFWEEKGAYTGEISLPMLKGFQVEYVIIGHSERRKYLLETDEMINKKVISVLKQGLKPILCIDNMAQLKKDLAEVKREEFKKIVIAFEPVSAIGTGNPYDLEGAEKMRNLIKSVLEEETSILYGGSVNSENAAGFIKKAGFQGLLIGGASLNPKEFIKIVESLEKS